MGTKVSLIAYAFRKKTDENWDLKNEVIKRSLSSWIAHKIESMKGKGDFVFLSETIIDIDEEDQPTLNNYINRMGTITPNAPLVDET